MENPARRSGPWRRGLLLAALLAAAAAVLPGRRGGGAEFPIRFEDRTQAAGLREPLAGMMGHGGAWGDVNGDGRLDLFVGGFCDRPDEEYRPAAGPVKSQLLLQQADGTFVAQPDSPASFYGRVSGAVFADLDNDGRVDLYSANNGKGRSNLPEGTRRAAQLRTSNLFRNMPERGLVDVSEASGACPPSLRTARNIGLLDYDGDGLLDLLVLEDIFISRPRSVLLRNLGGFRFADVTAQAGLPDDLYGLGLAVADVNADHWPDLFVGHSNRLFLSAGPGRFREVQPSPFAWQPLDREDWPCGAAWGDLNRDGLLDLVLAIHGAKARNRVYLNQGLRDGVPRFRDVTDQAGLPEYVPQKCPHVEIQDFDNDGWPDLYFSAAWLDASGQVVPLIFRHLGLSGGVPRFEPPRPLAADTRLVYFPAGPSADYDQDGRLDLFLINWFQGNHCRLLRNASTGSHWIDVRIAGGGKLNRQGIGAALTVRPAGAAQDSPPLGRCDLSPGFGYASGQDAVCHFGLGAVDRVDLEVVLPGGRRITLRDLEADRTHVVEAGGP